MVAVKADDIYSNKPVMKDVWNYLNQARLVIADLTNSNPNVFYELGIAHTLGKKVIMIAQHTTKVPFDVGHVRYINYVYPSQIEMFEARLEDTITQVLKDSRIELRLIEQEEKPKKDRNSLAASKPRLQRLSSLTDWARKWVANDYLRIIDQVDKHSGYRLSYWAIKEKINSTIRTEAVKRWSLSSVTAKDYTEAVLLTIEPEFQSQIKQEVEKRNNQKELARREEEERKRIVSKTFQRLETPARLPVNGKVFLDALVMTGKFTRKQAEVELHYLWQMSTIHEVRAGYYQRVRAFG